MSFDFTLTRLFDASPVLVFEWWTDGAGTVDAACDLRVVAGGTWSGPPSGEHTAGPNRPTLRSTARTGNLVLSMAQELLIGPL